VRSRQRALHFFFEHRLDEAAHALANAILDRIEPIVEKHDVAGD
jgi:hypothetical protein